MMTSLSPVSSNGTLYQLTSQSEEKSHGFSTDTSLEKSFTTGPAEHIVLAGVDYFAAAMTAFRGTIAFGSMSTTPSIPPPWANPSR